MHASNAHIPEYNMRHKHRLHQMTARMTDSKQDTRCLAVVFFLKDMLQTADLQIADECMLLLRVLGRANHVRCIQRLKGQVPNLKSLG